MVRPFTTTVLLCSCICVSPCCTTCGPAPQDRVFEGQVTDELRAIMDALPSAWLAAVQGHIFVSNDAWMFTTDPNAVVRVGSPLAFTRQAVYAFTRLSTGRLEPLQYLPFCSMPNSKPIPVLELTHAPHGSHGPRNVRHNAA